MGRIVLSLAALGAGLMLLAAPSSAEDRRAFVQAGETRFEALPPQELAAGRCGLFLWARTATAQPVLVLTAFDEPAEAKVRADGDRRNLERVSFEGSPVFGHFEHQRFSDGRLTLDVDLAFNETNTVRDGAMIQRGFIKMTDREGFETVLPVGGMVACQR